MNPFTHQRILHRLLAEVKEINTAMIQVGALALHVDQNLRNAVDNILIRIEKIRMELGKSTEALVNEDHQAPTVWGVLSALSASVAALEVLKASPPSDSYASQTALTTLEMKVDTLDAGMQDIKRGTRLFIERFQDSLFDSLQRLARKLKELDDQDVLHRLTRLDHQTKSSEHMETERCIDTAESDPLNLSDLLLESRLVGGLSSIDRTPQRQNHSSSGDTSQVAPMRRIPDALLELTERVRALELDRLQDAFSVALVLHCIFASTWWEWSSGSSLHFWCWPGSIQIDNALQGFPICVAGPLPCFTRCMRITPNALGQVTSKLSKVIHRGYIAPGHIHSLTNYFSVPKGDKNVRIVYSGTSSGFNDVLWSLNFWLPTADSALWEMSYNSFCSDLDLMKMFLKFPMDEAIRPFSGADIIPLLSLHGEARTLAPASSSQRVWFRWDRLFMGMKPSPYHAVHHFYHADELAQGSRLDPFQLLAKF